MILASEDIDRALIFTRTKHGADRVVRFLEGAGIDAFAIHGNKSQGQRTTALQAFRQGKVKLLVATDIAARAHRRVGRQPCHQFRNSQCR